MSRLLGLEQVKFYAAYLILTFIKRFNVTRKIYGYP